MPLDLHLHRAEVVPQRRVGQHPHPLSGLWRRPGTRLSYPAVPAHHHRPRSHRPVHRHRPLFGHHTTRRIDPPRPIGRRVQPQRMPLLVARDTHQHHPAHPPPPPPHPPPHPPPPT